MKMGRFEKFFVNSRVYGQHVGRRAERRLRRVAVEPGQAYLDFGCGNGMACIRLAERYPLRVTGIDVDPDQIRAAEDNARRAARRSGAFAAPPLAANGAGASAGASDTGIAAVRFLAYDGERLPFEDGEFDIVATNNVTHHIPEWETALAEMLRVLKPGGWFVYSDFVTPRPLAALSRRLLGHHAGFLTTAELDAFVDAHRLTRVRRAVWPLRYETICRVESHPVV